MPSYASPAVTGRQETGLWKSERLAYWYFRLNGFLTIENFVVHSDVGPRQETEADVLAVRFAQRAENLARPMKDHPKIAECQTFANVIIAEVTTAQCKLNGPWTRNMHRVLKALGCVPDSAIALASEALHDSGRWCDALVTTRVFAIGETIDDKLRITKKQQLTWDEIIRFCIERFREYRREKLDVSQWAQDGRDLMDCALDSNNPAARIRESFCLRMP
jgi:hypothetical protein